MLKFELKPTSSLTENTAFEPESTSSQEWCPVELTVLVVEPEGLPQLPLHLLLVLLDQELGRQLNELRELQFSGSVEINLADDFLRRTIP